MGTACSSVGVWLQPQLPWMLQARVRMLTLPEGCSSGGVRVGLTTGRSGAPMARRPTRMWMPWPKRLLPGPSMTRSRFHDWTESPIAYISTRSLPGMPTPRSRVIPGDGPARFSSTECPKRALLLAATAGGASVVAGNQPRNQLNTSTAPAGARVRPPRQTDRGCQAMRSSARRDTSAAAARYQPTAAMPYRCASAVAI